MTLLRKQGGNVKLVLLNIVNDMTYIPTSVLEWENHYEEVFSELLGIEICPNNVIIIIFDIG